MDSAEREVEQDEEPGDEESTDREDETGRVVRLAHA
jgi:hypothetical protein